MAADRTGRAARTGRLAPASEEPARGTVGPEGLELMVRPSRYEKDEISLVDLWLALVRRRFVLPWLCWPAVFAEFLAKVRAAAAEGETTAARGPILGGG